MFSEIIVCSLVYVAIVAIAFSPKSAATPEPVGYVDYFPETEPETPIILTSESEMPKQEGEKEALETEVKAAIAPKPNQLEALSIRSLKKLASQAKIKNYSTLRKKELILALS